MVMFVCCPSSSIFTSAEEEAFSFVVCLFGSLFVFVFVRWTSENVINRF